VGATKLDLGREGSDARHSGAGPGRVDASTIREPVARGGDSSALRCAGTPAHQREAAVSALWRGCLAFQLHQAEDTEVKHK